MGKEGPVDIEQVVPPSHAHDLHAPAPPATGAGGARSHVHQLADVAGGHRERFQFLPVDDQAPVVPVRAAGDPPAFLNPNFGLVARNQDKVLAESLPHQELDSDPKKTDVAASPHLDLVGPGRQAVPAVVAAGAGQEGVGFIDVRAPNRDLHVPGGGAVFQPDRSQEGGALRLSPGPLAREEQGEASAEEQRREAEIQN